MYSFTLSCQTLNISIIWKEWWFYDVARVYIIRFLYFREFSAFLLFTTLVAGKSSLSYTAQLINFNKSLIIIHWRCLWVRNNIYGKMFRRFPKYQPEKLTTGWAQLLIWFFYDLFIMVLGFWKTVYDSSITPEATRRYFIWLQPKHNFSRGFPRLFSRFNWEQLREWEKARKIYRGGYYLKFISNKNSFIASVQTRTDRPKLMMLF